MGVFEGLTGNLQHLYGLQFDVLGFLRDEACAKRSKLRNEEFKKRERKNNVIFNTELSLFNFKRHYTKQAV